MKMYVDSLTVDSYMLGRWPPQVHVSPPHLCCEKEVKPSTPVPELGKALKKHSHCCFVNYLITGLVQGFLPKVSRVCNHLESTLKESGIVDKLLAKGSRRATLSGPCNFNTLSEVLCWILLNNF